MREHYERLRSRALADGGMTLAMRMLIDCGVYAWIEAFGPRSCSSPSRHAMPDADARPTMSAPRPTELVSLLATLVANGRAQEMHS